MAPELGAPGTTSERAQAPWQRHPSSQAPVQGGQGHTALSFRLEQSKGSGKWGSQWPVCPREGATPVAPSWELPGRRIFTALLPSYTDRRPDGRGPSAAGSPQRPGATHTTQA